MTAPVAPGQPAHTEQPAAPRLRWYRRPVPLRLLLVLTFLVCLLAYAEKAACRDTRNWVDEFQYTRLCYSDVVALYGTEGLNEGKRPYLDAPVEYPVLIGAAMQLGSEVARLAPPTGPGDQDLSVALFFDSSALLLTLAAGVVVGCTALTTGNRPRDALLVALAPALVFHAFTNWDLLAVAFAAGGLLAWSRRAPRLAGALFGLGAATKFYPILLLVPLAMLCLRAGRLRTWLRTAGWALTALLLVNLPVYLVAGYFAKDGRSGPSGLDLLRQGVGPAAALAPHHTVGSGSGPVLTTNGLLRFLDLNSTRIADWDSLPFGLQYVARSFAVTPFAPVPLLALAAVLGVVAGAVRATRGRPARRRWVLVAGAATLAMTAWGVPRLLAYTRRVETLPVAGLNIVTGGAFVVLLTALAVLVLRLPRRPRVGQVAFLTVVAFLLTNKVYSPQYVLWLVPLAALARPRWRPILLWQLTELAVLATRYYYFAGVSSFTAPGLGLGWFVAAVAARDLALVALSVQVVRDMRRPEGDDVRRGGADDPAGGVLAGAPDRFGVHRPPSTPAGPPTTAGPLTAPGCPVSPVSPATAGVDAGG